MVKKKIDTIDIEDLYDRIVNPSNVEPGASIVVCAAFQRGTGEEGVWSKKNSSKYIDSLERNFPTQSLTFVKDYSNARSYAEPWKILDGANRSRAIRDFIGNTIKNGKGLFFKDSDVRQQERFKAQKLACEFLTIERDDPPDTIAIMFTRLNQTGVKLQPGELIKAHGWKGNVQIIEIAKFIIGDVWKTEYSSAKLLNIRKQWEDALGKLGETKRCNNIAMMCAYIISATKENFKLFDTKYNVLKSYFDETLTENDLDNVCEKISCFLDIIKETYNSTKKKGMPVKSKIAPIWFAICEGKMTDELYNTMIDFFHCTFSNEALCDEYESILGGKGDNHTTFVKMEKAIRFIQEWGR
jgi:hypothetical protein